MTNHHNRHKFDLSYSSIFRVLIVLAGLGFIYLIRDIIALVFVSAILAAAILPWVTYIQERWKMPRIAGVLIIYLIAFAVLSLVVALIIPPLSQQIQQIATSFPEFFSRVITSFAELQDNGQGLGATDSLQQSVQAVQESLTRAAQGVFSALASAFGSVVFLVAVLVLTLYLILEEDVLISFAQKITPHRHHQYLASTAKRIQTKMGQWLRGQLFLMLFVAVLTFIGLLILGLPFALVLALIAGLLELIPYAGPLLAMIPAVIVGLSVSPLMAALVVVLYFLVQQIENHLLVPKIMEKAVGLNPVIVIVAILMGAKLGGILGAILAVPVTTILALVLSDLYNRKHPKTADNN